MCCMLQCNLIVNNLLWQQSEHIQTIIILFTVDTIRTAGLKCPD